MNLRRSLVLSLLLSFAAVSSFAAFAGSDVLLPAVGHVQGVSATFTTTVWLTNPSSSDSVDVDILLLTPGHANLTPASHHETLAPGETKSFADFSQTLFGINGLGAARFVATHDVLVTARIATLGPVATGNVSQGLSVAGASARFGIGAGENGFLQGVQTTSG